MKATPRSKGELFTLERLVALVDGVFAVALTLLVLDLRLPSDNRNLPRALLQMVPGFLVYLIVFASIAGYWTIHHGTFRHIRHGDGGLIILSLLNLLFITLYPVTASILGAHPLNPLAAACLSINSFFYCMSAWTLWSHAATQKSLLAAALDKQTLKRVARIMLLVGVGLALAVPLAFLNIFLAYAIWILWPAVSATWVNRKWKPAT